MKRVIVFAALCFGALACREKDCSKINLDLLADIKYPLEVKARASALKDFPAELDAYLNPTHKLILRCRTESDFLHDRVLPGLMLWISDAWNLQSDTSRLGKIFAEHKIGPWERPRTAGVLFNRFANDRPLSIDSVLADAAVRTAWYGRIKTTQGLKNLADETRQKLTFLIHRSDSLGNIASRLELALPRAERLKKEVDEKIAVKNATLRSLTLIEDDYQYQTSAEKDIALLRDAATRNFLSGFENLSVNDKPIMVEEARIRLLLEEIKFLRELKATPTR